jgi:hypothetical protein
MQDKNSVVLSSHIRDAQKELMEVSCTLALLLTANFIISSMAGGKGMFGFSAMLKVCWVARDHRKKPYTQSRMMCIQDGAALSG